MAQQALLAIEHAIDPGVAPGRTEGADEADYCWVRARAETRRAREAVHPASRDAHLGMAALYHQRALAALRIEGQAALAWMREVGRLLLDG
jgi:hypothetical protein